MYIIRLYRVQEAGKFKEDQWSCHQEPTSIFVSNLNEKFNSGLTHELFAFTFYTHQKSDILGGWKREPGDVVS